MIPPTSIDGTDITGATIDGQDVQEITVDGQTVFTAGPTLPVAYSNLVAWYPFDSATYGGSNADDVTAIIGGSGDDTAYDGTANGATYQSSGGVTDINAGANSGAFRFDGSDDFINLQGGTAFNFDAFTLTAWINRDDNSPGNQRIFGKGTSANQDYQLTFENNASDFFTYIGGVGFQHNNTPPVGSWTHVSLRFDDSANEVIVGVDKDYDTFSTSQTPQDTSGDLYIGARQDEQSTTFFDGLIDDARVYNTSLSDSQVNQIQDNTPHP